MKQVPPIQKEPSAVPDISRDDDILQLVQDQDFNIEEKEDVNNFFQSMEDEAEDASPQIFIAEISQN